MRGVETSGVGNAIQAGRLAWTPLPPALGCWSVKCLECVVHHRKILSLVVFRRLQDLRPVDGNRLARGWWWGWCCVSVPCHIKCSHRGGNSHFKVRLGFELYLCWIVQLLSSLVRIISVSCGSLRQQLYGSRPRMKLCLRMVAVPLRIVSFSRFSVLSMISATGLLV